MLTDCCFWRNWGTGILLHQASRAQRLEQWKKTRCPDSEGPCSVGPQWARRGAPSGAQEQTMWPDQNQWGPVMSWPGMQVLKTVLFPLTLILIECEEWNSAAILWLWGENCLWKGPIIETICTWSQPYSTPPTLDIYLYNKIIIKHILVYHVYHPSM